MNRILVNDVLNLVDLMQMADQAPEHCSLDHVGELAADWGDPLYNLMEKERIQGGPIALCKDSL